MLYFHANRLVPHGWRVMATVAAAVMVASGAVGEESTNAVNEWGENEARIKVLRSQLLGAPLPAKFWDCVAATCAVEKRKSILDELYQLTDDASIDMEYEIAEMYADVLSQKETSKKVREYLLSIEHDKGEPVSK